MGNAAAKMKEVVAATEKRVQEAEKRAEEAMVQLDADKKATAANVAEAYRERRGNMTIDREVGEFFPNFCLLLTKVWIVAAQDEQNGISSNSGDVDVDMANPRQTTQQPEVAASIRPRVQDQVGLAHNSVFERG